MSTRSLIAREIGKNQYSVIYCHFDGYLEHNGKILYKYYNDSNKVDKLLDDLNEKFWNIMEREE